MSLLDVASSVCPVPHTQQALTEIPLVTGAKIRKGSKERDAILRLL